MHFVMDLRNFFSRKRARTEEPDEEESVAPTTSSSDLSQSPTDSEALVCGSKAEQKKLYKSRLTYRKDGEHNYPWVYCNDVKEGMFYKLC